MLSYNQKQNPPVAMLGAKKHQNRKGFYMCGIIGFSGMTPATPRLINGLRNLEYRGYDSAGIGLQETQELVCYKEQGRLANLEELLFTQKNLDSTCGIGQTRWATHGAPSAINAHPHCSHHLMLVHNGIIENYSELKQRLLKEGYEFVSQTDTEVAAHLIDFYYEGDPIAAIRKAQQELEGSYAFAILFSAHPDTIYALRKDSPLLVGLSDDGNYLSSDMTAILDYTKQYFLLEEGEIAVVAPSQVTVLSAENTTVEKKVLTAQWNREQAQKDGYPHFMLKEIFQQPQVLADTIHPRIKNQLPDFSQEGLSSAFFQKYQKIQIVACGTAMHAGLIAKVQMEQWARLPVEVSIASEFRYSNPILSPTDLVVVISQSGETADSLAALRLANAREIDTLGIVNTAGSSIGREASYLLPTYAGPEIAVASTKAFTVQLGVLTLLALNFALERGEITPATAREITAQLLEIPTLIQTILQTQEQYIPLAQRLSQSEDLFFIGRGIDYPLSMEGSLKLKEISYLHAEAYAAGELKHGTISLIEQGVPVIGLCSSAEISPKLVSNLKETATRGAFTILILSQDIPLEQDEFDRYFTIPAVHPLLSVFLSAVVMQLLAYHTSVAKGCDVDKPRNLAKSVTVE